jgi:DDE family transposase
MPMSTSRISGHESGAGRQHIGLPLACAATAGNVNNTLVFEQLFLAAFAAMARVGAVFADKGYGAEKYLDLCHRFGAKPRIHKRRQTRGWVSTPERKCVGAPE